MSLRIEKSGSFHLEYMGCVSVCVNIIVYYMRHRLESIQAAKDDFCGEPGNPEGCICVAYQRVSSLSFTLSRQMVPRTVQVKNKFSIIILSLN